MEDEKKHLETQLRQSYGQVTYSYTAHLKQMQKVIKEYKILKYTQIVLAAMITSFCLSAVIYDELKWIAALIAMISLVLNVYFKNFNLVEAAKKHQSAADKLWLIREWYVSLLTDLKTLSIDEIMNERERLTNETYIVYLNAPKTDSISYKESQEILKNKEEQFFTEEALDKILPEHLRKERRL